MSTSDDVETIWHPADIFSDEPGEHQKYALIVLNQPLKLDISFYRKIWANCSVHIGADGGANRVHDLVKSEQERLPLDLVIGDLDSLTSQARSFWEGQDVKVLHDPDQYSTDFTKSVQHVWSTEQTEPINIVVLGGLGGRVDQGISVLHHLYMFQKSYDSGKMFLLSSEGITFVLKSGKHKIKSRASFRGVTLGENVGIIPLKEPSIISTNGLEWDVTNWQTEFGGSISTSNHVKADWVSIETTKDVLFTIDFATLRE
ncbi:Thiamin pyrophosphokinase, catalytic [Glarea lozoyensis ATCC 20868]|uniref:Thiamine pyrophosphokinase n=1 Tax=Glarea lozoyensis (strain ATCC 20868 / MF5171) TaxID=1116229 RepID=S3CGK3_GLAL2|nr:thiamine pyrophosphokinase, catalytic [Glarea lozoyensis ATCC 20868]EPE24389.1 Thiamin pyrophosphokinase, catalytic [Glarea lozoyensis ATCC 20868]